MLRPVCSKPESSGSLMKKWPREKKREAGVLEMYTCERSAARRLLSSVLLVKDVVL